METISRVLVLMALLTLARGSVVAAQTRERSIFIGVKGGFNLEQAEDGLSEASRAGGLMGGVSFARAWAGEFELWVPTISRDAAGNPEHRDVLAGAAIVRFFGGAHARSYMLAGVTAARSENHFTICIADRTPPPATGIEGPVPTIVTCSAPDVRERQRREINRLSSYTVVGLGVQVPLSPRLRLSPELRANLAWTSVIVRPAIGLTSLF